MGFKVSAEFYNKLRSSIRISDIVRQKVMLTKKGKEYLGICPFHSEKTPSFTVNDAKRFYHCFGCSAHGDVIRFVAETGGMSYREAAVKLAGDNGIELPKMTKEEERQYEEADHIYKILELANQFFVSQLNDDTISYLKKRGLSRETIESFSIGYAPGGGKLERFFEKKSIPLKDLLKSGLVGKREDGKMYEIFNNRIIFPIRNIYNKIVGFGGRAIGDSMPKYINSPETLVFKKSETMYGENIATGQSYKDNYAIVVEGYMDVIALHQAGFKQAIASLGTSVTEKHIQKIWRSCDEIVACLDGDSAGQRASKRLIEMCLPQISAEKSISFIQLPAGKDPDDLLKSSGPSAFGDLVKSRFSLSEMIWRQEFTGKSFNSAEARASLERSLQGYCNQIADQTLRSNFKSFFKEAVWTRLIRKNSKKKEVESLSNELISTKQYTELEIIERAICLFLAKYPEIISNPEAEEVVTSLVLKDHELEEFKDWLIGFVSDKEKVDANLVKENLKNTGFCDVYLVLSDSNAQFLDVNFLQKNKDEHVQILRWLCKKHYLLLLKQEYLEVMESGQSLESKTFSYIGEIQRVSKELSQLSEKFIN